MPLNKIPVASIFVKDQAGRTGYRRLKHTQGRMLILMAIWFFAWGCAGNSPKLTITDTPLSISQGTILSTDTLTSVSFEELISDLVSVRVIYVGESHTNPHHHEIQLRILKALCDRSDTLSVGMEMFDFTYQDRLDQWSAAALEEREFLKTVHWYANWRYPYRLYRGILDFVRTHHLPLVGLNLPFHLPPKISIGGTGSLSEAEKRYLPTSIDLSDSAHRKYVQTIFSQHHIPGRDDFETFYEAQCVWDETMAERVTAHLGTARMLVLAGNGHIIHKFGIPKRVFSRIEAPYRTVILAEPGERMDPSAGDYIWVSAPRDYRHVPHDGVSKMGTK